jgi:hypothetical protein
MSPEGGKPINRIATIGKGHLREENLNRIATIG